MQFNNFFKIEYINVRNVEEYFDLPLPERTWYGLYKKPLSLPCEWFDPENKGWNSFYAEIKKEFPVQYFFREWLFSLDNPLILFYKQKIGWPIRDFKYAIRNFLKPCHPRWRKVLPRHRYSDIVQLIPDSYFALLLDFYYEEVLKGYVDWDYDEIHREFKKQLIKYVNWVEIERPKLAEKIDEALSYASKNKVKDKKGKVNYKATYKKHNTLEEKMKKQTGEILHWMVDNRDFFWT